MRIKDSSGPYIQLLRGFFCNIWLAVLIIFLAFLSSGLQVKEAGEQTERQTDSSWAIQTPDWQAAFSHSQIHNS